jgi:hypothetical protein
MNFSRGVFMDAGVAFLAASGAKGAETSKPKIPETKL